jgi:hypothetical protein
MTDTQSMLRVGTLIHRSGKLYVIHYVTTTFNKFIFNRYMKLLLSGKTFSADQN